MGEMFKVNGVLEPTEPAWPDDDSILRVRKRFSPEQQLLFALLLRNLRDAFEGSRIPRKDAIKWFSSTDNGWFTWHWTANHLNLSSLTVSRINALIISL